MNVPMTLSVRGVNDILRGVKALQRSLRDETIETDIVNDATKSIKDMLTSEVFALGATVDGNAIGTIDSVAELEGYSVRWQGSQIAYIEFGTGNRGYAGGYPAWGFMTANGYIPDPTKFQWTYERNGESRVSYGLAPLAPVYKTAQKARRDKVLQTSAIKVIETEIMNDFPVV